MKAASIHGFSPIAKQHIIVNVEKPQPRHNEVLVNVYGSSVNPKDHKLNEPIFSATPAFLACKKHQIFGDDLSGIIVDKGKNVSQFNIGDEIYGMSVAFRTGACAEYAVISESQIALKPNNISFTEAATVPLAGLTALQLLYKANVKAGDRVLIIGASGGVGVHCVQLAKIMQAHVAAVCSYRNIGLVESLGADQSIDYTQGNYLNRTDNFDVVIDVTSYESIFSCNSLLKPGGVYIMTMGHHIPILKFGAGKLLKRRWRSKAMFVQSNTHDLNTLRNYIEQGRLKPVIDSEYALEEIASAYQRSKTGRAAGKIAITVTHHD